MAKIIRIIALSIALAAISIWIVTGASRGWSKNSVPITTIDEVTGIEAIKYEKKFVAGVDFLGAALLGAAALTGVSYFVGRKQKQKI